MAELPSCALCRRGGEAHVAVAAHAFCVTCLRAVGHFFREGSAAVVESLWGARPRELARRALSDLVDDEIAKIRQTVKGDVDAAIAAFKAGLLSDPQPSVPEKDLGDPVAHLDLAIGYRAMGLTDDALGEAAMALGAADRLGDRAHEAAAIVFNPGVLRSGLDETIVRLRTVLFPA